MIKALIIDDEPRAHNVLHQFIISFAPEISVVRTAASVEEAKGVLEFYQPDLVFLDVGNAPSERVRLFATAQQSRLRCHFHDRSQLVCHPGDPVQRAGLPVETH